MMGSNNTGHGSDRSHLCLAAIYSIHVILLNVFLQENVDAANSSIILRTSYVIDCDDDELNVSGRFEEGHYRLGIVNSSRRSSALSYWEEEPIGVLESSGEDSSIESSRNDFLRLIAMGIAEYVGKIAKTSGELAFDNRFISALRTIIESLSPAELGMISGCLVFLLTSAEKDCV